MVLSKPSITITDRHWASRKQIVKTIKKQQKVKFSTKRLSFGQELCRDYKNKLV